MTPTEHSPKTPSPRTGIFALLSGLLRAKGTSAGGRGLNPTQGTTALSYSNAPACRPIFLVGGWALITTLLALVLTATTASAAQTRNLLRTFGCPGPVSATCTVPAPAGATLTNPQGEAVDQSSGDVYVADTGNNRVEKFDPAGEFLLAFGLDVNTNPVAANRDVCTAPLETCQEGAPGSTPGAFTTAKFIAIDQSSHDVYVADTATNTVSKFTAEGVLVESWGTKGQLAGPHGAGKGTLTAETGTITGVSTESGSFHVGEELSGVGIQPGTLITAVEPGVLRISTHAAVSETVTLTGVTAVAGIAVGGTGTLYLASWPGLAGNGCEAGTCQVFEYTSAGAFSGEVELKTEHAGVAVEGLAVDTAGDLFRSTGEKILKFASSGAEIGVVEDNELAGAAGAAGPFALEQTGDLFVAGEKDEAIEHFSFNASGEVHEPGGGFCVPGAAEGCGPTDSVSIDFAGSGIAVSSAGDSYISNASEGAVREYGELVTVPDVKTEEAKEVKPRSAVLHGTVNPDGVVPLSECGFEYGAGESYDQTAACVPAAGSISSEQQVSAEVLGLTPGTTYHFRLKAGNANGFNTDQGLSFETPPPPAIDGATITALTESSATLNAQIDPQLSETHYHFEYLTAAAYAANGESFSGPEAATSVPGAKSIPATNSSEFSTSDELVHQSITKLEANKTYYWRVVATNESGTTVSVQHTFIDDTSGAGLPDNRAYELVSAGRKNGTLLGETAGIITTEVPYSIAPDGARVIAKVIQCFGGSELCTAERKNLLGNAYEFTRAGGGWVTTPLAPSAGEFPTSSYWSFDAATGAALFSMPTDPKGEDDFYVRESESGRFLDIGPNTPLEDGPLGPEGGSAGGGIQAFTPDYSHLVWGTEAVWPFDERSVRTGTGNEDTNVYEYTSVDNSQPFLVGVTGGAGSHSLLSSCQTGLGAGIETNAFERGDMSEGGNTVFFTAFPHEGGGGPCAGTGENAGKDVPAATLYARVDGEASDAHTVAISDPSPSRCGSGAKADERSCREAPPADAAFVGASAGGSKAFFLSSQQLTDEASEDASEPHAAGNCRGTVSPGGCNLYELEGVTTAHPTSESSLVDVSAGDTSGLGPRVRGMIALTSDGSHVYFVAKGELTKAERPGCMAEWEAAGRTSEAACHAVAGANNLYVYSDETHGVSFIAALPGTDETLWSGAEADTTPDGRFLVFTSHGDLTADDTSASGAAQAFRYDAVTGGLIRLSIGNRGFDDNGNRSQPTPCTQFGKHCSEEAKIVPPDLKHWRFDPTMSDSGARVFFTSPIALTPAALEDVQFGVEQFSNLPEYVENVYEWEQEGVGSCPAGRAPGCVFLISDGSEATHDNAAVLLGSDSTGDNVFLGTGDSLVPADTNSEYDYYDARVCEPENGDPCVTEPPPAQPCLGEVCHGTPAGTPGVPTAPSVTFNGQGNLNPSPAVTVRKKTAPRCKRGFVRKKVKKQEQCVKRPKKKAKKSAHLNRTASR